MAENSKIEWTDTFDPQAIGRQLGAYKSAAKRIGCSFEEWMAERAAGAEIAALPTRPAVSAAERPKHPSLI